MKIRHLSNNHPLPKEIEYTNLFVDEASHNLLGEWISVKGKYNLTTIKNHNLKSYKVQSVSVLTEDIIAIILVEDNEDKVDNKKTITKLFKGSLVY